MPKQYQLAVVIGRFQPFHCQHARLIVKGLELADNVVVLIGGNNKPRTPQNPFTVDERSQMIRGWAEAENISQAVHCEGINDFPYSDVNWASAVQQQVNGKLASIANSPNPGQKDIVLVGCKKDSSSFYLDMFPQWDLHTEDYHQRVDATQIRELMYDDRSMMFLEGVVHDSTLDFLREFQNGSAFKLIQHERGVIQQYKKSWESAPYAPTFVTVDAVVVCSGHVLVIKRGAAPGKGLSALPGGFLDPGETIENAMIRELREETRLKIPVPVLRGSIVDKAVFDHPDRSARGRTITHAFLIVLPSEGGLPKVKGGDDAASAAWRPIGSLDPRDFFEDHYHIIEYFAARV